MPDKSPQKPGEQPQPISQRHIYQIELRGTIGTRWLSVFEPLSISSTDQGTKMQVLTDQAGLRGLLNHLWDLNLDIVSMIEIAKPVNKFGGK